ncbi:hypothetical protein [Saccharopolyspora shandongensis]|uniref:hypothetical protein n=1 Tax=Saccharopolyspora shandongensis TaxID=418495 RepID=UPI003411C572
MSTNRPPRINPDPSGSAGALVSDARQRRSILIAAPARERQGVASALNDVTREFGTALGVALLSAGYRSAITPRLDGVPADTAREPGRPGLEMPR